MVDSALAHQTMKAFCKDRIGIGIAGDMLAHLAKGAIQGNDPAFLIRTKHSFLTMPIGFRVRLNAAALSLDLANSASGKPGLRVRDLIAEVDFIIGSDSAYTNELLMATATIGFTLIQIDIVRNGAFIGFNLLEAPDYLINNIVEPWTGYPDIHGTPFDAAAQLKWQIEQAALLMNAPSLLAITLASAVSFPPVLDVFYPLKMKIETIEIEIDQNLVIIAGDGEFDLANCPFQPPFPANPDEDGILPPDPGEDGIVLQEMKDGRARDFIITRAEPFPVQPVDNKLKDAHLFLYAPIVILEKSFDGNLKAAVTISDKISFGPIYARYALALSLAYVKISLTKPWPLLLLMSLKFDVHGDAGAGIEIGKIKWEHTAIVDGKIDPLEIEFSINFDWLRLVLFFMARFIGAKLTQLGYSSGLGYPLDKVAGKILQHFANKAIKQQGGKVLASASVPIADISKMSGYGKPLPGMAGEGDAVSTTVGIGFTL
jgi:hypothetical protein